jgi:DNA-binding HxlR family transcriptional regulator
VVRELLCGSTRFNEIRRGVPRMSPSLLSKRLLELEEAGVVSRESPEGCDWDEYRLTEAGQELLPIIQGLGTWGKRWITGDFTEDQLDVELLMWDLQRRIEVERVPGERTVVLFEFSDVPEDRNHFWLVVDRPEVDLCVTDPGHPVDLTVHADLPTMTGIWMGNIRYAEALRRKEIRLRGPAELRRSFPNWLGLSLFAGVERPPATLERSPGGHTDTRS